MNTKKLFVLITVVALVGMLAAQCGGPPALGSKDNPIVMSFVPSGDTQEIITGGEEIAKMLGDKTGLTIKANVATSFAAVVEAMGAGTAHVGWLNTFSYLLAHEQKKADVLLITSRFGTTSYQGEIIVRADSGIKTIADLKGKTFCFVDPLSTSGYIIPSIMFKAEGIDPEKGFAKAVMAGSHNNVVAAVYKGDCDGGAVYSDARGVIEKDFPDVKTKVIVIATSVDIPNDTVSVIPGLPEDLKNKIKTGLLDIAGTEEGKKALQTVYQIEGLQEVQDSYYDPFRALLSKSGVSLEELAKPKQ
jgi:phosphonate transport system substrate-binding protein